MGIGASPARKSVPAITMQIFAVSPPRLSAPGRIIQQMITGKRVVPILSVNIPHNGDYGSLEFSLVSQIREKCSVCFSVNRAVFPRIGLLLSQGQSFVAS